MQKEAQKSVLLGEPENRTDTRAETEMKFKPERHVNNSLSI